MIKHSTTPLDFPRTLRPDNQSLLTSGRAGEVIPFGFIPLFREDSATGRVTLQAELAEMPRPLENAVLGRLQTWCVPRVALPHFAGADEFTHAYQGKSITQLGAADRTPPSLYDTISTGAIAAAQSSEFFRAIGVSLKASTAINTDYVDSYILVQNFRLAQHSSKLTRYDYYQEDATAALELKPAFWPKNQMHSVVPDYEEALVVGGLNLEITAGQIPVKGMGWAGTTSPGLFAVSPREADGGTGSYTRGSTIDGGSKWYGELDENGYPQIFADLDGVEIPTTLASIDMARKQQAFAKAVSAMDGNLFSGYNNDDVLILELMNGMTVDPVLLNRPWLLDSKTAVFGMTERHATDAANLDDSSTVGQLGLTNQINVPPQKYGAIIFSTFEFMPERLYERAADEYLTVTSEAQLPNALRDSLNQQPVETVTNGEIDTAHTSPAGTFGYRELNGKWDRDTTRMGGNFRQLTPGTPNTTARTAIWQVDVVDPVLTADHWVCEHPFPQDVFAVTDDDSCILSIRIDCAISGLTQKGNRLVEDNADFAAVTTEKG